MRGNHNIYPGPTIAIARITTLFRPTKNFAKTTTRRPDPKTLVSIRRQGRANYASGNLRNCQGLGGLELTGRHASAKVPAASRFSLFPADAVIGFPGDVWHFMSRPPSPVDRNSDTIRRYIYQRADNQRRTRFAETRSTRVSRAGLSLRGEKCTGAGQLRRSYLGIPCVGMKLTLG